MACHVLQKYAATQKMTGNEQARSGHFCLCGYGAKAPLRLASQPHFWSGAARKFGKERTRVWGRSAQQAEDCEAIPKKPGDGRWSLLQSDGFRLFHCPRRLFAVAHRLNWRKLFENGIKPVRQDGSRAQAGPGAELEAAEASNVLHSSPNFCFSMPPFNE